MEKQVLSIKVTSDFYHRLRNNVPKGKVSAFIEEIINKELIGKEQNCSYNFNCLRLNYQTARYHSYT